MAFRSLVRGTRGFGSMKQQIRLIRQRARGRAANVAAWEQRALSPAARDAAKRVQVGRARARGFARMRDEIFGRRPGRGLR